MIVQRRFLLGKFLTFFFNTMDLAQLGTKNAFAYKKQTFLVKSKGIPIRIRPPKIAICFKSSNPNSKQKCHFEYRIFLLMSHLVFKQKHICQLAIGSYLKLLYLTDMFCIHFDEECESESTFYEKNLKCVFALHILNTDFKNSLL